MKQKRPAVATTMRRRYGSYLGEISPARKDTINGDFLTAAPNEQWLTDITESQIPAGMDEILHARYSETLTGMAPSFLDLREAKDAMTRIHPPARQPATLQSRAATSRRNL
ncbi:hypothetical protein C0Z16_03580 [Paraburkholderia rhynchosiae]|uniref:Transposase n=1 Tax=Paraburkholderia rhynchosiae TaxID=487049 RepID=A0ABX4VB67_9BURK|nr:hypothetical protein C0Z16_03580 [Paraburkholderia rhynchosiae]